MKRHEQWQDIGRAGVSLTEMFVVLALIGILSSLAIPSFLALTRATPHSVGREILHLAQLTRLNAIKTGVSKALILDGQGNTIRSEAETAQIAIPFPVAFSAVVGRNGTATGDQGAITFFPNGSSTGGLIRFQATGAPEAVLSINWLTGISTFRAGGADDVR